MVPVASLNSATDVGMYLKCILVPTHVHHPYFITSIKYLNVFANRSSNSEPVRPLLPVQSCIRL